jgi:hypothetical protein
MSEVDVEREDDIAILAVPSEDRNLVNRVGLEAGLVVDEVDRDGVGAPGVGDTPTATRTFDGANAANRRRNVDRGERKATLILDRCLVGR